MRKKFRTLDKLKLRKAALEELRTLTARPITGIRQLEKRMAKIYKIYGRKDLEYYAAECIDDLKLQRWCLLRDSFEWTDENVARLEAANEQLKEALLDMRRQTIEVYEAVRKRITTDQNLYVYGSLWVKEMAFENWQHDEDMQYDMFDIMTSSPYSGFYSVGGVSMTYDFYHDEIHSDSPDDADKSENYLLYLENTVDNWNELMPIEKTGHLHLVYAIHNLYEHCNWSLQDILAIKSYHTKIEIEYAPR